MRLPAALAASLSLCAFATTGERATAAPAWPDAVVDFTSTEQMLAVADRFPNSSGMQRRRLGAALERKDPAVALDAARRLATMGASLSAAARTQVESLIGGDAMTGLAAIFDANAAPVGTSTLHAVIPAEHRLIEGLIWDRTARLLYATSVVDRRLLTLGPGGAAVAAEGGLGSLFGGAYDPARRRIWLASARIEQTPKGGPLFSGLIGVDPAHSFRLTRIAAPEGYGGALGDVAVAPDGTLYASDGLKGAVYRCRPGCAALESWLAPGSFRSAQGMAVSANRKWLYVADYRYGLAAVDRKTGSIVRVEGAAGMMLDGIDGLAMHGRDLIAIQNGIGPVRIVRLVLSANGLAVARLEVLERANPQWGEPSLGAVVGDLFLYVANPQWERYGEGGTPAADKPARSTMIRALDLARRDR